LATLPSICTMAIMLWDEPIASTGTYPLIPKLRMYIVSNTVGEPPWQY
jgi:hypothetical protein